MSVSVLTLGGPAWEAPFVRSLDGTGQPELRVVRRCADVAELLSVAASGVARVAVVGAGAAGLDGDALARLAAAGVAVVAVAGTERDEARMRQLRVGWVVPAPGAADALRAAVVAAAREEPAAATDTEPPAEAAAAAPGRVVAVWGPAGAPGRSTVAAALAAETALLTPPVLLVDADTYGGVLAQALGVLDESPGLAAACRAATAGGLDAARLAAVTLEVAPGLRLLTGISRAARWVEVRPPALEQVLALCRALARLTVVDCGFCIEQDEELSYDTAAPQRNGATIAAMAAADEVCVVGAADPIGMQRLVRALGELRELLPDVEPRIVLNRVRGSAVAGDTHAELAAALRRYAGVEVSAFVPADVAATDAAAAHGRLLAQAAPRSPARLALRALAERTAGVSARPTRRWSVRRAG